jgi:hypothetical protein
MTAPIARRVVIAFLLSGGAGTASAQSALPELSAGYQVQRFSGAGESFTVPKWVNVDFSYPITGVPIAVVGQFDFARKSDIEPLAGSELEFRSTFNTYAFGGRYTARPAGVRPFVHVLGGAQRLYFSESIKGVRASERFSDWSTSPLVQLGGGVAVPITRRWSALGQMDYRRIFADEGTNNVRFVGGFRLGIE